MREKKRVCIGIMESGMPKIFFGKQASFTILEQTSDGFIQKKEDVTLTKFKRFRMHGQNVFSIEDDSSIYYVLMCKSSKFEEYLAFSNEFPKFRRGMECTRLVCEYDSWREQEIITHRVRSIKKITPSFFRVRTKHTYYVLVN